MSENLLEKSIRQLNGSFKRVAGREPRNLKGFVWDIFILGITLLPILAIIFIIFTLLWMNTKPALTSVLLNSTTPSPMGANAVANFGDSYFLYTGDTIILVMYFMMILACFINARYEGGDTPTLAIGLLFLVVGLVISFPISDFAHNALTNAVLLPATSYYKGTLYILDNLPTVTAVATLVYLVLVVTNRGRSGGGYSPTGGPIASG